MKVGDLVRVKDCWGLPHQLYWVGVIVGLDSKGPIVYWNSRNPNVHEYTNQLELISESKEKKA